MSGSDGKWIGRGKREVEDGTVDEFVGTGRGGEKWWLKGCGLVYLPRKVIGFANIENTAILEVSYSTSCCRTLTLILSYDTEHAKAMTMLKSFSLHSRNTHE